MSKRLPQSPAQFPAVHLRLSLPPLIVPTVAGSGAMDNSDSNALIVPDKKRNKKEQNQGFKKIVNGEKNMSNNCQKRKLKKLMEKKEMEQLLSKSPEILKKHKIEDDLYSCLWASEGIDQAKNPMEKRRKLSNANHRSKRTVYSCDSCETEVVDDERSASTNTCSLKPAQVVGSGSRSHVEDLEVIHKDKRVPNLLLSIPFISQGRCEACLFIADL